MKPYPNHINEAARIIMENNPEGYIPELAKIIPSKVTNTAKTRKFGFGRNLGLKRVVSIWDIEN